MSIDDFKKKRNLSNSMKEELNGKQAKTLTTSEGHQSPVYFSEDGLFNRSSCLRNNVSVSNTTTGANY